MKIVIAFALLIVIVNANPFEEQEEVFEREGKKTVGARTFEIFDKDGDGIVSIADMVKLIKSIGLSYQGNKIRQKIEQADTNGDNAIDFDEFMTFLTSAKGVITRGVKRYFKKIDKDKDRFISKAEFKKKAKSIMKNQGKDITNDEIKDTFKIIDSNEDGKISLDEFEAIPAIPDAPLSGHESIEPSKSDFTESWWWKLGKDLVAVVLKRLLFVKANPLEDAKDEEHEDLSEPEDERSIEKEPFQKFDKNNDGFISKSEFKKKVKHIMRKMGKDFTNDEIKDAFKIIDADGDGQISSEEFEALPNIPIPKCPCWVLIAVIILLK